MYFTRERHRRERAYFGPYSSAKRVRGTLDLLGKIFLFRSCEGAEPGRRSGSPCLDYYIKRCGAPCVGYVSKEEYREGIDGVVAFLSGRFRQIERDLETRMHFAAGEQDYEQAALERNRLHAVRALLERQRVASDGSGTFDAVAVVRGRPGGQRAGLPGARRRALGPPVVLPRQPGRAGDRHRGRGVHAPVLHERALDAVADRRPAGARGRLRARRPGDSCWASGAAAPSRCAPPSAAASAASSSWPSATRGSRSTRRSSRPSAGASSASRRWPGSSRRSGSTPCPCGSSASTSRTSAAPTPWPRWWCSRAARRRRPITAGSRFVPTMATTTSLRCTRCSRVDTPNGRSSTRSRPMTPIATRRSPRCRTWW